MPSTSCVCVSVRAEVAVSPCSPNAVNVLSSMLVWVVRGHAVLAGHGVRWGKENVGVFVNSSGCNRMSQTGWLVNTRHFFLEVQTLEVQD